MHGLVNCAIQRFVTDTYGKDAWTAVTRAADLEFFDFEAMLVYDDRLTPDVLDAASVVLERARADVMEDIGTYLVSHRNTESLRRLLRFGGVSFVEFLHSLDDLPDRARLAVSDLHLPEFELHEVSATEFKLICPAKVAGFGFVMMGVLRAMADDYGVLAFLDHRDLGAGQEVVTISLIETDFSEGRGFELGARCA